jgi:hypothetical protein
MQTPDANPAGATLNLLTFDIEDWRELSVPPELPPGTLSRGGS